MKNCRPPNVASLLRHVLAGDVDGAICTLCLRQESLLPVTCSVILKQGDKEMITVQSLIKELRLAEMLEDVTSKKVCDSCLEQLSKFYLFKLTCSKTVSMLNHLVNGLCSGTDDTTLKSLDFKTGDSFQIWVDDPWYQDHTTLFECQKCYLDFKTIQELSVHQIIHGRSQYYLCRVCGELLNGFQRLVSHRRSDHPDHPTPTLNALRPLSQKNKSIACSEHSDTLQNQASNIHDTHVEKNVLDVQKGEGVLTCKKCNAEFLNRKDMRQHQQREHELFSKCNICSKTFQADHRCKFTCLECPNEECLHRKYLNAFYRDRFKSTRTCIDCGFAYKGRASLIEHVNRCHLFILPHVCRECGKKMPSRKALSTHRAIYHPANTCPHCNVSIHKHNFEKHVEECSDLVKPYGCDLCDGRFPSPELMVAHRKSHIPSVFKCKMCPAEYASRNELKHHVVRSHEPAESISKPALKTEKKARSYHCAKCVLVFPKREESLAHEMGHPADTDYLCPRCDKTFVTKADRLECLRSHKADLTEVCPLCGRMFTKTGLQMHFKVHAGRGEMVPPVVQSERRVLPKNYACDICGSGHGSSQAMSRHRERHKKQLKCPHCSKLIWPRHMRKHLSLHQNGPRDLSKISIQCKECSFSTHIESVFEGHINKEHRKVQPYQCEVCEKRFYSKARLVTHSMIHTAKVRTCAECGKEYRSARGYVLHMRQHRGETRFACEHCPRRFVASSRLREHEAAAHYQPRYQCASCDASFHRLTTVKQHISNVHYGEARRRRRKVKPL